LLVEWQMKNSYPAVVIAMLAAVFYAGVAIAVQINIPRVELMPNMPAPYQMRDWKQVARDYDNYVFSFTHTTSSPDSWWKTYPIIWWDNGQRNYPWVTFGMPSYIWHPDMFTGNAHEAINCLGAVLGGSLAGIDKSNQFVAAKGLYYNFVLMEQQYYNLANGENMVLNYTDTESGHTFWYEVFPPLLFCQLLAKYPNTGSMETLMSSMADRMYDAEVVMGGSVSPWTAPDFTHTAFNFLTMDSFDGDWKEPDAAAGYAWIEYMAYVKWGAPQHLTGAKWGIEYLQGRSENPLYEVLLPYGAYTAARMNAEVGTSYNLYKILNWCFQPSTASDARYGWGVIADNPWGGYDCDGLVGSVTDTGGYGGTGGYAFAMNTFQWPAALTPIPRYNQDYARAIGKWILNAANAARLFYANGLDAVHQSDEGWAYIYDPCNCIAYEGLRKQVTTIVEKAVSDYNNPYGLVTKDYKFTFGNDGKYEELKEVTVGSFDKLEHVWQFNVTSGSSHSFNLDGHYHDYGDIDTGFIFSYATSPAGPYTTMFTVNNISSDIPYSYSLPSGLSGTLYIMAKDTHPTTAGTSNDLLQIDCMYVSTNLPAVAPYATGDGFDGLATNFALYGASHVGMLAAVVNTTNVEKILQLDLLATDYYHAPAYPTFLYYNPYGTPQTVDVNVGSIPVDIYDTVSQTFLKTNVSGVTNFNIGADSAVVIVLAPAGGQITISGTKKLIDGVVVDYKTNTAYLNCAQVQASPQRLAGDINGDCVVDMNDLSILAQSWLLTGTSLGRVDINDDNSANLFDFSNLAGQWLMSNVIEDVQDVQIESFDNFAANGWSDGYSTGLMVQATDANFIHEGAGALRAKYEAMAPGQWDIKPTKVFSPELNIAGATLSFWLWTDLVNDSKLNQVIVFDYLGRIARYAVPKPSSVGWTKIIVEQSVFVPDASPLDYTRIMRMEFWFSTWDTPGNSVYLDDLRMVR
jgi:hypothetical protein